MEVAIDGVIEKVLVANEEHALDVVLALVALGNESEERYGGGHFEECVAKEFKAFVVAAHPSLEIDLFFAMIPRIIAIFCESLKGKVGLDVEVKK